MASVNQNQGENGQSSSVTEELSRNLSLALMAATNGGKASGGNQRQSAPQLVSQQEQQSGASGEGAKDKMISSTPASAAVAPQEISSSTETAASSSEDDAKPSTASSLSPEQEDNSVTRKKPGKKDRSKLRKGKWTVEEEEYTTRIIHHFSTGLLTLPEGATLRSYLADKLNCDPMRITKKFAGASCLGRRVFHLRNRPQPSYEEIQMAKTELEQLEQRFRLRVEHGYGGMPLTNRPEMMLQFSSSSGAIPAPTSSLASHASAPAVQTPAPNNTNNASSAAATAFLQNFAALATAAGANNGNMSNSLQLPSTPAPAQSAATALGALAGMPGAAQWLLPNPPAPAPTPPSAPAPSMDASVRAVNDAVTNWAWTQVAASLSNALPQLNASNLQQQQQLIASLSSVLPQLAAANLQQTQQQNNPQQQQGQPPQQQFFQQQQQQVQPAVAQAPAPSLQQQQSLQSQQQQFQPALQSQQQQTLPLFQSQPQVNSQPSFQPQKVQQQQQQQKDLPQPAFLQQNQANPEELLNKAHADEANSFALQLRKAYEKQLKAREEAEKKKSEAAKKPAKMAPKKKDVEAKVKNGDRRTEASQSPKIKPQKVSRSHKDGKSKEARASQVKLPEATKGGNEPRASKQKEVLQPPATPAVKPPMANGVRDNKSDTLPTKRTDEDKEAGTILMGFLSSLRDSYEDALRNKNPATASTAEKSSSSAKKRARQEANGSTAKKQKLEGASKASAALTQEKKADKEEKAQSTPLSNVVKDGARKPDGVPTNGKRAPATASAASSLADSYRQFTSNSLPTRRNPPNYITDMSTSTSETSSGNNSTNPVESSLEDSDSNSDKCGDTNSDKGKDNPSSSEEDNKLNSGRRDAHFRSKGPPRKRIKSKKMSDEMLRNQSGTEEKAAD